MTWLIGKFLGKCRELGLLPSFGVDEMINAEHEDDLRDLEKSAERVHVAKMKREEGTRTLREAINRAKAASPWQDVDGLIARTRNRKGRGNA